MSGYCPCLSVGLFSELAIDTRLRIVVLISGYVLDRPFTNCLDCIHRWKFGVALHFSVCFVCIRLNEPLVSKGLHDLFLNSKCYFS